MNYSQKISFLENLIIKHDNEASISISLIASGNIVSPFVKNIMNTDLMYRAAEGKGINAIFPGLNNFYEFEEFAENELARIFNADFADLRPLSGSQANHIVLTALSNIGDYIIVPSIKSGGHISTSGNIIEKLRGYKLIPIDNKDGSLSLDFEKLEEDVLKYKPKIVFLGGSVITEWNFPKKNIIDLIHFFNGIVVFDAAHVAGLIAMKEFPNPLDFGADIMTMTTCKTIPGPSHGWIFGKRDFKDTINRTVFPGFVSGGHLQEHVGAVLSLFEILKHNNEFGVQILKNSRLLGKLLEDGGFHSVKTSKNRITDTHQVVISHHNFKSVVDIEKNLAAIGIFLNKNLLPVNGFKDRYGLRLGTQEITRLGANEETIVEIVKIINSFAKDLTPNISVYRDRVKTIKNERLSTIRFI